MQITHAVQHDSGMLALLRVLRHTNSRSTAGDVRWELLEDEHFSGTVRNELTEPDEGVSVESRPVKDLHGIRPLVCGA